jgi:hypothetical protein
MSVLNGKGSGSNPLAATADWNLAIQPAGVVLVSDGYGNVAGSGVLLSTLETQSFATDTDCGTF